MLSTTLINLKRERPLLIKTEMSVYHILVVDKAEILPCNKTLNFA